MSRLFRYVFLLLILASNQSVADVILSGAMKIGDDNQNDTLNPVSLLNTYYSPVNPIHFSLTQSTNITGIRLNGASGANYPISFIIWNSNGQAVIPAKLSSSGNLYSISGNWTLPAGDYSMAVWGQCVKVSLLLIRSLDPYDDRCGTSSLLGILNSSWWEDISFTSITLIGATSSSFNFIKRQHIGDSSNDLSRWFPSQSSGMYVAYEFTLNTQSKIDRINYFRMRDVDTENLSRTYVRMKNTTQELISGYLPKGNYAQVYWEPSYTLSAGTYELIVQTSTAVSATDADDISWDDVVIKTTPIIGPHHYEIYYPNIPLSCEPAAITIKACSDSNIPCQSLYTTSTSVTLFPSIGWSGGNQITIENGKKVIDFNHYASDTVAFGVNGANNYSCFKGGILDSSCQTTFVTSKLNFNIPSFYAGGNSANALLTAVQASASNPAVCTTLFANQTQNINFSSQYILPSTGSMLPSLNGTTISSKTLVPVAFNSSGVGVIKLAYNDAGVLRITAEYLKTDITAGDLSILGSDNVAVLPQEIQLTAAGQACSGTSDATYAACTKYKTVGDSFSLNAEAGYKNSGAWQKTGNFTYSDLGMNVLPVIQHKLVAPSAGSLPDLATTTLKFSGGTATASISESDVGVYQYGVTDFVPYPGHQDESPQLTVPLSWSAAVGRFVPAKLQVVAVPSNGSLTTDTCSTNMVSAALGYTGQALRFATMPALSMNALGSDGLTVMKNYQGAFAKITSATPSGSGAFTANLLPKNNVNSLTSSASWAAGSWSTLTNAYNLLYSFGDSRFTFTKTSVNQVAPFETALTISALADSDGVSASSLPLNLLPVAPDTSAFKVYSGRLTLESVNGAENNGLALPFYMQYWNGSAYAINSADNCTSLTSNVLQMNNQTNWTGIPLRVASATNSVPTTTASLSQAKVSSGVGTISFTAPNASGWVDIAATSSLPDWMKDYTLPSGLTPARASFGYYRGNDRLIYRREVFGGQ